MTRYGILAVRFAVSCDVGAGLWLSARIIRLTRQHAASDHYLALVSDGGSMVSTNGIRCGLLARNSV